MLAQDKVADANRLLAYHGYLQRERVPRSPRCAELDEVQQVEARIVALIAATSPPRAAAAQLAGRVNRDRNANAKLVAQLDKKVQGPARARTGARARRQTLGRAGGSIARRRRVANAAKPLNAPRAAEQANARGRRRSRLSPTPAPRRSRSAASGWPLSGSLLARFGGTLPDGRRSSGLLIAAAAGTPVRAVADGRVVFAEWMSGYGLICIPTTATAT